MAVKGPRAKGGAHTGGETLLGSKFLDGGKRCAKGIVDILNLDFAS
jgi:hypothetical protein